MKKRSLLFILGIFSLCIGFNANAATVKTGVSSVPTDENNARLIPVTINVTEEEVISKVKFDCSTDYETVECSFVEESGFTKQGDFIAYISEDKLPSGDTSIGKVKLLNKSTSKINDVKVTIKYTINDVETVLDPMHYELNAKVEERESSTNPNLLKVTTTYGKMVPEFSQDVYEYTIYDIQDTILNIKFTTECVEAGCSVSLDGGVKVNNRTVELAIGKNTVTITSTSENTLNTQKYTFTVYKGETTFNSPYLKELSFGEYKISPSFNKNVYEYNLEIPNKIVSLYNILNAVPEDTEMKAITSGTDDLKVGENTVTVKVKNRTGDQENTYTIKVYRASNEKITIYQYKDGKITYINSKDEKETLSEEEFKKKFPDDYNDIINKKYDFDEEGLIKKEVATTTAAPTVITSNDKTEKKSSFKLDTNLIIIIAIVVTGIILIVVAGIIIFGSKKPKEEKDIFDNKDDDNNSSKEEKEELNNTFDLDYEEDKKVKESEEKNDENNQEELEQTTTVEIDEAINEMMNDSDYKF